MSKVVLSEQEKKEFFKRFLDAIEYSYKSNLLPDFLIDFFSDTEVDTFIKRLEVFKRLSRGESYAKLNHELSVSPITTSKVSKSLRESSENFKKVIEQLCDEPSRDITQKSPDTLSKRKSYLG
mgnify:CR=1 FL=1